MSNPFDDLKSDDEEPAESEEETQSEPESKPVSEQPVDEPSTAESTTGSTDGGSSTDQTGDREESENESETPLTPAEIGPAFEYSEVQQKPFYARTETVNEFENQIRTTIVPTLAEAEILDEETREIHDAVLRLANENPERIAELVLEERRQAGNQ
ncbi:hypothetical protein [Natronorubrum texcoconense]|uniref:Uncharacterized protein n=1 Tax=Natronorubrum texcoconense TaxID=1095776 RepID=A0A1G9D5J7_9EURY|nr:hypothetical protein [Natronorubrum texcoconense]SDK59151.1 hypothetical protein SAMN04515672_3436 [Natronorubrum texcoconense]